MRSPLPALHLSAACFLAWALGLAAFAFAEGPSSPLEGEQDPNGEKKSSPWLLAPVLSSNPKLGTALGAIVGYIHKFDPESRPSVFAASGQYTSTDSMVAGVFGRASFERDRQRLNAGVVFGNIRNDYDDYLGTGVPLKTNAGLRSFIARYLHRVIGDWFIGAQGIYQNFTIAGETHFDDDFLGILGIAPYKSGGLGLVGYHDSRDNDFHPTRGWTASVSNLAYRQALGGEANFDIYRIDYRGYFSHGAGNVVAVRQLNHLTRDAPTQNLAPIQLRGYKTGQYSGKYMSQIEGEERLRIAERWTATIFGGLGCTYGQGKRCSNSANVFPMVGAGVQYVLKPELGIVLNLEYAHGKDDNRGVILKTGYTF